MGDNEAAKGLLTLFDATAAAAPVEKKKRAHKPRRPYRCGRCGLPKSGHLCAFRTEQRSIEVQTDHTSLATPEHSLTLLVPSSSSSDDASEGSSAGEHLVRSVTDDARESDDGLRGAKPGGGDDSDRGTHTPPAQRQRIAVS